jgi:hypothetical protein
MIGFFFKKKNKFIQDIKIHNNLESQLVKKNKMRPKSDFIITKNGFYLFKIRHFIKRFENSYILSSPLLLLLFYLP